MTDPTPQRAASAEERERLRRYVVGTLNATFRGYSFPGGKWSTGYGAEMAAEAIVAEVIAPLLDRITAAEARAEEAERKQEQAVAGGMLWQVAHATLLQKAEALLVASRGETAEELARANAAEARAEEAEKDAAAAHGNADENYRGLINATADRDRLADEVALLRQTLDAAAYLIDRLEACHAGKRVRDLDEATSAYETARALTATGGPTDDQA